MFAFVLTIKNCAFLLAVLTWGYAVLLFEDAAEMTHVLEAALTGYFIYILLAGA